MAYLVPTDRKGTYAALDDETNQVLATGRLVIPFIPQGTDAQIIGDVQFVTDPTSADNSASQADVLRTVGGLNA